MGLLQACPAAGQNRRLNPSPTCTLIDLVIGGRLCCQIPIRLNLRPMNDLRITTVLPQRRPVRRGYVRGLAGDPDVVQYLLDLRALGDKGDQAHLATAHRAQQWKDLVDAGYQHRPQVVR